MPGSNGKTRLPNKVQWNLGDITAGARRSHRYLAAVKDQTNDPVILGLLVELSIEQSEILMHAILAMRNEYLEHPLEDQSTEDILATLEVAGLIPARQ